MFSMHLVHLTWNVISGSQTFVEWADLVLNLQFGRHVSSHKHLVKGINTILSFKSPTWVLHHAELVFYHAELVFCWMPMCLHSLWCWCMGQSTNSVHPFFWVLGFSNYWLVWIHMIGWGSIQCQIQSTWFISLQRMSVTHYWWPLETYEPLKVIGIAQSNLHLVLECRLVNISVGPTPKPSFIFLLNDIDQNVTKSKDKFICIQLLC
jgi:hypothetical protein